ALWRQDSVAHRPPQAERLEDLQARSVAVMRAIIDRHPDQSVAVVSHGGPIKSIICWAINAPLSSMRFIRLDNGAITSIRVEPARMQMEVCNDTCHLGEKTVTPVF
ncbi:MAG: histidine phosphatase family protein, partial [Armatimonadota bacterium]